MPGTSTLNPDNILRFLQLRSAPASVGELAKGLGLKKSDTRPLFKMLAKLKKRRAIEELPGGRYRLPGRRPGGEPHSPQPTRSPAAPQRSQPSPPNRDELTGRLILHPDGYGFVVPDIPIPQLDGDVFIPRDAIQDAMHGDHVLVKMQRRGGVSGAQRAEGYILRILNRAHPTIVGLFRYGARGNVVLPYDVRLQHEVEIAPGYELTSGLAKKLGFSGLDDRSLRGRRIPRLAELDGAVVNVELIRYPRGGAAPSGRVIEILGRPGDLGVDTEIIIRKHLLPHLFPAEVMQEAEHRATPLSETDRASREDFRHLPIVTIDGETARDFDDAVYVERLPNSHWLLHVHISAPARHFGLFSRSRRAHAPGSAFEWHVFIEASRRPAGHERAHGLRRRRTPTVRTSDLRRHPLGRAHDLHRREQSPRRRRGNERALRQARASLPRHERVGAAPQRPPQ